MAQGTAQLRIVRTDFSQFPTIETTIEFAALQAPPSPSQAQPDLVVSFEGKTVPGVERRQTQVPGAVMLVTDLSSRMGERGAVYATRFQLMQPMVSDLVSQLQSADQRAGLMILTETVTVAHELTNDLGAIANTLTRSNPQVRFDPQLPTEESSAGPYPLDEAIIQALSRLDQAAPEQPRTLVVFAAGDPNKEFDTSAIHNALAAAESKGHPVHLLIYGFASDPTALTGLQSLADVGTVTPVVVDGQLPSPDLKRQIFDQYASVLRRSNMTTLRFSATGIASGPANLTVSVGIINGTASLDIPALPPVVSLITSSPEFQGTVQMATRVDFQQAPITQVEYLLNGLPIADPVTEGPDFRYVLDTNDPGFQQRFPSGSYELIAAVKDAQDQVSRSQPQQIEIAAVTSSQGLSGLFLPLMIGGGVVLVVGAAGAVWQLRRRQQPRPTAAPAPVIDDDMTARVTSNDDEATAPYSPDDVTGRLAVPDDERTALFDPHDRRTVVLERHTRWYVEVVAGDTAQRIELKQSQRNYDLGRVTTVRTPDIPLRHQQVSRDHARIELLNSGPTLIAGDSSQGTFFGPEKAAMAPGDRKQLASGDVFWLSSEVKLRVFCEITS
ncbi:FHA domain-containing protein [Chloroflexales bacterium ZM16-3]|nr:FHA domain-containing protein [Chloroflexales bacterium ZM16-3]